MGLSSAVDWWEMSQLRFLVISSLIVQWILLISSAARRRAIPGWSRKIIWLAFIGGDSLAIYALATLFNRHKNQDPGSSRSSILEVVWAPVLLIHLGGNDGITAYNLEDNELWTRHAATAVSQVTVAVYVFIKSWPREGGDKRLLQAAILLFFVGIMKCVQKPWALMKSSFNSMASSFDRAERRAYREEHGMTLLENFVRQAREHVLQGEEQARDSQEVESGDAQRQQWWLSPICRLQREGKTDQEWESTKKSMGIIEQKSAELFVDLACPYADRLSVLQYFVGLNEEKQYSLLQGGLGNVFSCLYTKMKAITAAMEEESDLYRDGKKVKAIIIYLWAFLCGGPFLMWARPAPIFAAIGLFHRSHRESFSDVDVKVTYALLVCGALLEYVSPVMGLMEQWPGMVSQYNLIGFFARNRKHSNKWCLSSCRITLLVLQHLKDGWMREIRDTMSYWKFNDHRGESTLKLHGCNGEEYGSSLKRQFDESVLLWHIATDICFYSSQSCSLGHTCTLAEDTTFFSGVEDRKDEIRLRDLERRNKEQLKPLEMEKLKGLKTRLRRHQEQLKGHGEESSPACKAVRSRQISNYMMYLLVVKPEMLLPGSRQNLFKTACDDLKHILEVKEDEPASTKKVFKLIPRFVWKLLATVHGKIMGIFKFEEPGEGEMQGIIDKLNPEKWEKRKGLCGKDSEKVVFIRDAWVLAKKLQALGDEKMWDVIQGVWVEMICFSAGRCRGYLHAKALGTGGELLSYVWLLRSHMGMETFTERLHMQREVFKSGGGNSSAESTSSATPTSEAPTTPAAASSFEVSIAVEQ